MATTELEKSPAFAPAQQYNAGFPARVDEGIDPYDAQPVYFTVGAIHESPDGLNAQRRLQIGGGASIYLIYYPSTGRSTMAVRGGRARLSAGVFRPGTQAERSSCPMLSKPP